MIRVKILEDYFLVWSLPIEAAQKLCPPGLTPHVYENRAWVCVSLVHFQNVRLFGFPVARDALVAAQLLVVSYRDKNGNPKIGNYFLKGVTNRKRLVWWNQMVDTKIFTQGALSIQRDQEQTHCQIADWLDFLVSTKPISPEQQRRLDALFAPNQSGVMRQGRQVWFFDITKTHWKSTGRETHIQQNMGFFLPESRFEFAFDTSNSQGIWHFPKKIKTTN